MRDFMDDFEEDFYCEDSNEYLLENWTTCEYEEEDERYKKCTGCANYEECLDDAEDNRGGYESFCDIVSDAYGSVDAFWECNGI